MLKFENFKKGPLTTVIGSFLMLAAVYIYLKVPHSEVFCITLLGIGALAFGLKDPKIPPAGGLIPLLLFVIGCLLTGCVTYNKCLTKFGELSKDSVFIPVRVVSIDTVTVVTPADSLEDHFNVDSLFALVDTIRQESASGKLQIKFWKDKYTRQLHYRALQLPDTIEIIKRDTVDRLVACPPSVVFDPDKDASWFVKLWEYYKFFAAIALLVLVFVLWLLTRMKHVGILPKVAQPNERFLRNED